MIHRLAEEAGAGHCSDAYQPGQILAEFQIAVIAEFGNVQQDIIRPLRIVVDDVQIIQSLEEQLLLVGVFRQQIIVVILSEFQSRDHSLLQGGRRANGQKIMHLFRAVNDLRWGDDVPQAPAGDGIGLGEGRAGNGPLPHSRQRGKIGMSVRGIDDVLIDLVGDDIHIVLGGQRRNGLQLFTGKDLAAGIGGIAEHQCLGVLAEGVLQYIGIKPKIRRRQRHIDGLRAGKDGIRAVVLIERGENHNLVAGIGHGHHSGHHGFRAAAGGDNLAVGVDGAAHITGLLGGQRLPEILCAPGDGILVIAFVGRLSQTVKDLLGRFKIRKALRQVYRIVLKGYARHPANDGVGKAGSSFRKALHGRCLL